MSQMAATREMAATTRTTRAMTSVGFQDPSLRLKLKVQLSKSMPAPSSDVVPVVDAWDVPRAIRLRNGGEGEERDVLWLVVVGRNLLLDGLSSNRQVLLRGRQD